MLACFYIEGAGYQENMLPKYHKLLGHDVSIVTKSNDWKITPVNVQTSYLNAFSIPVTILATEKPRFSNHLMQTLYGLVHNKVLGLYEYLCKERPDIIFVHGCQHIGNLEVLRYIKNHPTKLFIDQHGDYYNSPINTPKQKFIARYYMGGLARKLYDKCVTFWGVTPWRVKYLKDVYRLPENKVDLLIMGGDDEKIDYENRDNIKREIRLKYGVADNELLIVTGGKIDKQKCIDLLIKATAKYSNVKILIFGKPVPNYESVFYSIVKDNKHVISIGWISSDDVYNYFLAADLVVFPGTHSVLWEQAVACGTPCVFRRWDGMDHVNVSGNSAFIDYDMEPSVEAIDRALYSIINDNGVRTSMKRSEEHTSELQSLA